MGFRRLEENLIDLVKERLAADDAQKGFILDGFPRNTMQAVTLDSELSGLGRTIDCALLIDVEPAIIIERLSSRRTCRACGHTGRDGISGVPTGSWQLPQSRPAPSAVARCTSATTTTRRRYATASMCTRRTRARSWSTIAARVCSRASTAPRAWKRSTLT